MTAHIAMPARMTSAPEPACTVTVSRGRARVHRVQRALIATFLAVTVASGAVVAHGLSGFEPCGGDAPTGQYCATR